MTSSEFLDTLNSFTHSGVVHMYLIERRAKPGVSKKVRASARFDYYPQQINMTEELVAMVHEMLKAAIKKRVSDGSEIKEYSVIEDTTNKIQKYTDLTKIAGFKQFLKERLSSEVPLIDSLEDFADIEKAWALCYGFYNKQTNQWLYCIKKLAPRRLAVETNVSKSLKEAAKNGLQSIFDVDLKKLKPLNGFALNIEPSIDMIYLNEEIYVFRQKAFEDITSLTQEYEALATDILAEVESLRFIEGISYLQDLVDSKPSYRSKIIKAKEIGNIKFLNNCDDIGSEFKRVGERIGINFTLNKNGRLLATNESQAKEIIQVLSEYFKEGIFNHQIFETAAGRIRKE